jgi:uncharacterized protein (TIGR03118 family)
MVAAGTVESWSMRLPQISLVRARRIAFEPIAEVARRERRLKCRPRLESLEGRALLSHVAHQVTQDAAKSTFTNFYKQTNLVSDDTTTIPAENADANLVNPWGLARSTTGPFWVANNGTGLATAYNSSGVAQSVLVTIPSAGDGSSQGTPSGEVANNGGGFKVSLNKTAGVSQFIFATEDGTISGWSPTVSADTAIKVVDNSSSFAVYKGLAMATTPNGLPQLYAANFRTGGIDVFADNFNQLSMEQGTFTDPHLPRGYAPFGIFNYHGDLMVTYAKQDSTRTNNVAGKGDGFVDLYTTNGTLIQRVASRGKLNSPWGMAIAPSGFGRFSNDLLIGNFGDGHINAFKQVGRRFVFQGQLQTSKNHALVIDGLWSLVFGNDGQAGSSKSLFFTSGPNSEADGLFGVLNPVTKG